MTRCACCATRSTPRRPDELIGDVYTRWFALDISVRDLFPPTWTHQRAAFAKALSWLLGELIEQRAEEPVAFLAQLGRDHRKYGVTQRALRQHADRAADAAAHHLGDRWDHGWPRPHAMWWN